jgi:ankyrin repeat protein
MARTSALQDACFAGNVDNIRTNLKIGADINERDGGGVPLLIYAAYQGHVQAIQLLCEAGADVNSVDEAGRSAIWTCAQNGHEEAARVLHYYGADVNMADRRRRSPIWRAAYSGYSSMIRVLFELGGDLSASHDRGAAPLYVGAEFGNVDVISTLCELGADINTPDTNESTPLLVACLGGHLHAVLFLLSRRANVNYQNNLGRTPMHEAAYRGDTKMIHALLQHGAEHIPDHDRIYPLSYAAYNGHVDAIRLLVRHGAVINGQDIEGRTALWTASQRGHCDVVIALIELGADICLADHEGRSPVWRATFSGHLNVIRVLASHGAPLRHPVDGGLRSPIDIAIAEGHTDCAVYIMCHDHAPNLHAHLDYWQPMYKAISSFKRMIISAFANIATHSKNVENSEELLWSNAVFDFLKNIRRFVLNLEAIGIPSATTSGSSVGSVAQPIFSAHQHDIVQFIGTFVKTGWCGGNSLTIAQVERLLDLSLSICRKCMAPAAPTEMVKMRQLCLKHYSQCDLLSVECARRCRCAEKLDYGLCVSCNATYAKLIFDFVSSQNRVRDVYNLRLTSVCNCIERRFTAFGSVEMLEADLIEGYVGGVVSGGISVGVLKLVLDSFHGE